MIINLSSVSEIHGLGKDIQAVYKGDVKIWPVEQDKFNVSLSSNNDDWGLAYGSGEYDSGSTVQISAIPSGHYKFVKWSDGSEDAVRDIVVDHDIDLTAFFAFLGGILEYFPNKEYVNPN